MLLLILFSLVLCSSVSAESDLWKNGFFYKPPAQQENKGHNETPISPTQYEDSVAAYENQEYDKAYSLLLPLAEKGNPKAELRLGRICLCGSGWIFGCGGGIMSPSREIEAATWLRLAAKHGEPEAQNLLSAQGPEPSSALCLMLRDAECTKAAKIELPKGLPNQHRWAYLAALDGDAECQYFVGQELDGLTSVYWLRRAAEQGLPDAQFLLASSLRFGHGVAKNEFESASWMRRAAEQGHGFAQSSLADLYYFGRGVPQDYFKAYLWAEVAATNLPPDGRDSIYESLDQYSERLTPSQIIDAKRLAALWKPKPERRSASVAMFPSNVAEPRSGAEKAPLPFQTNIEITALGNEKACDGLRVPVGLSGERPCMRPGSGQSFRDCPDCPEMVVVPAGSFTMGSPENEPDRDSDEGPQHRVTIPKPFAVGKFAVTFAEWDACVSGGGCDGYKPENRSWNDDQPVINVSWNDAQAYIKWLTAKTGKTYRLLSEAEFEYAARAGTETPYRWGSSLTPDQANYSGTYAYGTMPVESFKPNPWGLYQVHGNVWILTEDCHNDSYKDAPTDGSASTNENCSFRVIRGGSFYSNPKLLRAAARFWSKPDIRSFNIGFRLARTLLVTTNAVDQTRTGLPLDLDYSMSSQQVLSHLKLLDMYRVESGKEDAITYITPAPDTDTKNGLFLQFKNDKLVEIASMKTEMDEALYNRYVSRLLEVTQQWKSQGVESVYESKASSYYLYRDNRSYMTISGGTVTGKTGRFSVTTTFSEKRFFEDSPRR